MVGEVGEIAWKFGWAGMLGKSACQHAGTGGLLGKVLNGLGSGGGGGRIVQVVVDLAPLGESTGSIFVVSMITVVSKLHPEGYCRPTLRYLGVWWSRARCLWLAC